MGGLSFRTGDVSAPGFPMETWSGLNWEKLHKKSRCMKLLLLGFLCTSQPNVKTPDYLHHNLVKVSNGCK